MSTQGKSTLQHQSAKNTLITGIKPLYLEDHPGECKWLGSPAFINHKIRPFGRGWSHNPIPRGRKRSPWWLTTYTSPGMMLRSYLVIHPQIDIATYLTSKHGMHFDTMQNQHIHGRCVQKKGRPQECWLVLLVGKKQFLRKDSHNNTSRHSCCDIPTPLTPILRGDLQKCNVHFSMGGGGLKMYLGPPPRGFQVGSRGGGGG